MFDIGWSELLVIAIVAIVVVGPKELPRVLRTFGNYAGKLKRTAAEFRRQFDEAMLESELEERANRSSARRRRLRPGSSFRPRPMEPVMLPKASSPRPDELPGEPVALPGSPANPVTKRAAQAAQRRSQRRRAPSRAAKRAAPAKPAQDQGGAAP